MKKKSYKQVEKIQDRFIEEYFMGTKYAGCYSGSGIETLGMMQSATGKRVKDEHLDDLCLYVLLKNDEPLKELPEEYCRVRVYYRVAGRIKALEKGKNNSSNARKILAKLVEEYFANTDNEKYLGSTGLTKLDLTVISLDKPTAEYSRLDGICLLVSLKKEIPGLPQEYGGYKVMYRITGPIKKRKARKR